MWPTAAIGTCGWLTRRSTRRTAIAKTSASAKKRAFSWRSKPQNGLSRRVGGAPSIYTGPADMSVDLGQLSADGGWVVLQAVIVLIVSFVGARLALSWPRAAMRRARVDLG